MVVKTAFLFSLFLSITVQAASLDDYNQGSWGGCVPISFAQALKQLYNKDFSPFDFMMRYKLSNGKISSQLPSQQILASLSGAHLPAFLEAQLHSDKACLIDQALPQVENRTDLNSLNDGWGFYWQQGLEQNEVQSFSAFARNYFRNRKLKCQTKMPKFKYQSYPLDRSYTNKRSPLTYSFESLRNKIFGFNGSRKLLTYCKQVLSDEHYIGRGPHGLRSDCELHTNTVQYISQINGKFYLYLESTWGKSCRGLHHCDVKTGHFWLSESELKNNLIDYTEISKP